MKTSFLTLTAMLACAATAAASGPLWLRNSAISPDGSTVAFTYKGDIYTVPAAGGTARQLTTNPAYDTAPVWSPDGSKIAFASRREGSLDVFVMPAAGGPARRLTSHSSDETPFAFADNDHVLYNATIMPSRDTRHFKGTQVYSVSTQGGRPSTVLSLPVVALDADGKGNIVYQDKKGVENVWRKHERSSGTGDVWLATPKAGGFDFKCLTDFNGHDINPVFGPDGTIYYVSEADGTLNVWSMKRDGSDKRQLTHLTTHPVRSLSASDNGTLAFSYDGSLYTLTPGAEPRKIEVTILTDEAEPAKRLTEHSSGISDIALSPEADEIAMVVRGNVYVTSEKYKTTKRITDTPEQERNVTFSPDGKKIYYDSERNGVWDIYEATIKDPKEKKFAYATEIVERRLTDGKNTSFMPKVSPDGKKLAYLQDRHILKVMDLATGKSVTALDGKYNYSYTDGDVSFEWSPDSQWLLSTYIGPMGWNNQDVAISRADGSETIDLTESGYSDGNAKWALGGKAIAWESDRKGYRSHGSWGAENDVYLMFLDPKAYADFRMTKEEKELAKAEKEEKEKAESDSKDKKGKKGKKADKKDADKKVEPLRFQLDDRKKRLVRLTDNSSALSDFYLNPEGTVLYYLASFEGPADLWKHDLEKDETTLVSKGVGSSAILADKKGKKLFFANGRKVRKFDTESEKFTDVEFEAISNWAGADERKYILDHTRRLIADKFYDTKLHGVDWNKYCDEYAKFLPYINNNDDMAILLSELLGELNASHTGSGYRPTPPRLKVTADLGLIYDPEYTGDGLKVSEVIKRGAADLTAGQIAPGDVITRIDGEDVKAGADYFPMLSGKAGRTVLLDIKKADGKTATVKIKPDAPGELAENLYQRWLDRNRQIVDSVSGGRIGYVHIRAMDGPSFNTVYDELLGKYRNCDAVVIDTRYNGGGWLHNDIAVLFNGKKYVEFSPRGQVIGMEPFSQWTKPSLMLVNETNYSDAHGTPYTYKTLGLGKVVGAPIPGTMTAVWWETQVDPTLYVGVPQVTNLDLNGNPLENKQLDPDVLIYNTPADMTSGYDRQLIEATRILMNTPAK